jgi:nucleoid DNA-binding protein
MTTTKPAKVTKAEAKAIINRMVTGLIAELEINLEVQIENLSYSKDKGEILQIIK